VPSVSARHFRIYSVLYDDTDYTEVDTLVYGENVSQYGTYWNNLFIGHKQGSFLLSNDDELKLGPKVRLRLKTHSRSLEASQFDPIQERELQVRKREASTQGC
jgi:hypothetical protein